MTTPGQITFSGQLISGLEFIISGISLDTVPEGLTWEQLSELGYLDRIRFEGEAVLEHTPSAGGKLDGDLGDETKAPVGKLKFKAIRSGFRITGLQSAADRDAAWRKEHGEPQTA